MRDVDVVTCFLMRRPSTGLRVSGSGDEVLLLRRSGRVGTYRGRWAAVSGYIEPGVSAIEQAYREIEEEVGLGRHGVRLLAQGEPLVVPDETIGRRWTVHPFLFEMVSDRLEPVPLRLDWEHEESRWVKPHEVAGLETVPGLAEALARVYAGP